MVQELCEQIMDDAAKLILNQPTFMLVICVLNIVFSLAAILGNLLAIHALWKSPSIAFTVRALFLNLAVSDLAVGLIVQPIFTGMTIVMLKTPTTDANPFRFFCPTTVTVFRFLLLTFAAATFSSVVAIGLDRLLALSLHLRYQELVTTNRVCLSLVFLWISSAIAASIFILLPKHSDIVVLTVEASGVLLATFAYFKVTRVALNHRNQINIQSAVRELETTRVKRSAFSTLYVYAAFLLCYLPNIFSVLTKEIGPSSVSVLMAYYSTLTMVFFNSTINPLIYCARYREIRKIMGTTLKNICVREQTV